MIIYHGDIYNYNPYIIFTFTWLYFFEFINKEVFVLRQRLRMRININYSCFVKVGVFKQLATAESPGPVSKPEGTRCLENAILVRRKRRAFDQHS